MKRRDEMQDLTRGTWKGARQIASRPSRSDWIRVVKPSPAAELHLLCFSYAGGGASVFREWADRLGPSVEVLSVQLPGREERLREDPLRSIGEIARHLKPVVRQLLSRPFAFFGHSMGALVAFELFLQLDRQGGPSPSHFFASACRAPQVVCSRPPLRDLPEDEFLDRLKRMGSLPEALFAEPELLALFSRTLRADLTASEVYRFEEATAPLDCPLTLFASGQDPWVSLEESIPWCEMTSGKSTLRILPGGHLFLRTAQGRLLRCLNEELGNLLCS
jgi:medium-chain acyl-[acyl-carrier-protein] hydrolase